MSPLVPRYVSFQIITKDKINKITILLYAAIRQVSPLPLLIQFLLTQWFYQQSLKVLVLPLKCNQTTQAHKDQSMSRC
jgi:hypothetical protein